MINDEEEFDDEDEDKLDINGLEEDPYYRDYKELIAKDFDYDCDFSELEWEEDHIEEHY